MWKDEDPEQDVKEAERCCGMEKVEIKMRETRGMEDRKEKGLEKEVWKGAHEG